MANKGKSKWLDNMIIAAIIVIAILSVLWMLSPRASNTLIKPGQLASNFELTVAANAPDGRDRLALSDYKGRAVAIVFFSRTCRACKAKWPAIRQLAAESEVAFIGIAREGGSIGAASGRLRRYAEKYELDFPILLDHAGVSRAYGIQSVPQSVLITADQIVAGAWIGLPELSVLQRKDSVIIDK